MAVYVDREQQWGWRMYGRYVASCHMIADTPEELHAMADRLGLSRRYVQTTARGDLHYDLTPTRRARAVAFGAVAVARSDFVRKLRQLREGRS